MLAEAFCASDERVRRIQAELDDAQAARTRTLAAFAVTVGNDGTIADVMGLNEREVRLARRTVGKENARTLAADLLRKTADPPPAAPHRDTAPSQPVTPENETRVPGPRKDTAYPEAVPQQPPAGEAAATPAQEAAAATAHVTGAHVTTGHAPVPSAAGSNGSAAHTTAANGSPTYEPAGYAPPAESPAPPPVREEPVVWSSAMDSVLVWSWQSGVDLQAVAAELDLDMRALLQRVQTLAAEGLLVLKSPSGDPTGQAGRHRRREDFFVAPDSPEELYTHAGYVFQPY